MDSVGPSPVVRPLPVNRRFSDPSLEAAAAAAASAVTQNGTAHGHARRLSLQSLQPLMNRQASGSPPAMDGSGVAAAGPGGGGGAGGRSVSILSAGGAPSQRPCPCARVVQFGAATALHLPSTPLALCPNPLRKKLFLQQQATQSRHGGGGSGSGGNSAGSQYRMEENGLDYYPEASSFGGDEDEEFSSGDEDDFFDGDDGSEPDDPVMTRLIAREESGGKLAFGRRKLKFFDQVTARDREEARAHLKRYWREVYKRRFNAKLDHLRRGRPEEDVEGLYAAEHDAGVGDVDLPNLVSNDREDSPMGGTAGEGDTSTNGSARSELAAAFLLESMVLNPEESLEGMAECYDGLVAAGAALVEHAQREARAPATGSATPDSQQRTDAMDDASEGNNDNSSSSATSSPLAVLSTLTPLLITTLEPQSGEAIVALSKLYNTCATARYRRRLIHRIAPHFIRPPRAALWCLKHQSDMTAIISVTELLLQRAGDIFAGNWVERGKFLKADGLRAENLRLAALQLKNLSRRGHLTLQIATKGTGTGTSGATGTGAPGSSSHGSGSDGDHHALAEWEILAVDRYIRTSIRHVFERTWVNMKVSASKLAPRDRGVGIIGGQLSGSSSVSASSGVSGCPMSPRKIPLSPSTFSNASSANPANSSGPMPILPQVESMVASSGSGTSGVAVTQSPSGLPPSSAIAASSAMDVPLTPKPSTSNLTPINTQSAMSSVPGTPPRSPCSPPKASRNPPSVVSDAHAAAHILLNAPQVPNIVQSSPSAQASTASVYVSSSAAGITSGGGRKHHPQPQPVVHYTLTKNSEERKRTVAACRALRAQITRFEEAFVQMHGRPPKGATERAPLATTYAQYREWKRAIRADAATRIQALFRGARCRWLLLRSSSPRLSRVVRRSGSSRGRGMLGQLSIPAEIGAGGGAAVGDGQRDGVGVMEDVVGPLGGGNGLVPQMHVNMDVEEQSCQSTEGVELVINTRGGGGTSASGRSRHIHRGVEGGSGRSSGSNKFSSPPGSSGGGGWHLGRMRKKESKERRDLSSSSGNADSARTHLLSPNSMDSYSTATMTTDASSSQGSHYGKNNHHDRGISAVNYPKKQSKYSKIRNSSNVVHLHQGHHYTNISGGNSVDSDNDSDTASHSSRGSFSAGGSVSLGEMSIQDLMTQKRELKAQLKSYDMNFARKNGRMPVKAEKEPIRHLYEQYNSLKAQISLLESSGASVSSSVGDGRSTGSGNLNSASMHHPTMPTSSRRGGGSNLNSSAYVSSSFGSDRSVDSSEDDSSRGAASQPSSYRHKERRQRKDSSSSLGSIGSLSTNSPSLDVGLIDTGSSFNSSSGGGSSALLSQDLSSLKTEKGTLHQMLRSYEKDFFKQHNRQVSSFADIRPVAAQYRRYKEIKKAIAALQAAEK